jgi:hypothetical protein
MVSKPPYQAWTLNIVQNIWEKTLVECVMIHNSKQKWYLSIYGWVYPIHLTIFKPTITLCKHTCAGIMIAILEHAFVQQR